MPESGVPNLPGSLRERVPAWLMGPAQGALAISARAQRHRVTLSAGGLAYFAALSMAPAAVVVGWIAGIFLQPAEVRSVLGRVTQVSPGVASSLAPFVDATVSLIEASSGATFTIATAVSVLLSTYAASRMVDGARLALSTTFDQADRHAGVTARLVSTVITLIGLVAAVGAIVALTLLPRILHALQVQVRLFTGVAVIDWGILAILVWLVCRSLISRAPRPRVRLSWASPGPFLSTGWILACTIGLGIYVRMSSALGAAIAVFGSAIVVLLWLYLCFLGLLYGAEVEAHRQASAKPD